MIEIKRTAKEGIDEYHSNPIAARFIDIVYMLLDENKCNIGQIARWFEFALRMHRTIDDEKKPRSRK